MQAPFGVMACQRAEAAWALVIRDNRDLEWALTWEWAISIRATIKSIWAFPWEWALAQDTMIVYLKSKGTPCDGLGEIGYHFYSYFLGNTQTTYWYGMIQTIKTY